VSGGNDFISFCADRNVATEANLAFYIFQGVAGAPLPIPVGTYVLVEVRYEWVQWSSW